jgi:hypothetical protein
VRIHAILISVLCLSSFAAAQTLQGTVTNGTTGKPAANAEVTLISLSNGMNEAAHTRTDSSGHFTLDLAGNTSMPHLVRVTHQDVNYFKMAPPGTSIADVQIYDAVKKLDGIATTVQVMRMQSDGSTLQVMELYAVQNNSAPPRSLIGDHSYEVALPEAATIDEASARAPNGQPISTVPEPVAGKKNQYAFSFPLRPGETQFEVAYHLPYSGSATIRPVLLHDAQHFVAMVPKSMQFASAGGTTFRSAPDGAGENANVQVVTNTRAGAPVAFSISGTGTLADQNAAANDQQDPPQQGGTVMGGGPGGGLGKPIDSPDPLSQYRWPLLGALAVILVTGGVYVVRRGSQTPAEAAASEASVSLASPVSSVSPMAKAVPEHPGAPRPRASLMLEALKEELFTLELERQQGRITEEEYIQAKAALDHTLKRALTRAN